MINFPQKYKTASTDYKDGVLDFMDYISDHSEIDETQKNLIRHILIREVLPHTWINKKMNQQFEDIFGKDAVCY